MKIEFDILNGESFRTFTFSLKFQKKAHASIIYMKHIVFLLPSCIQRELEARFLYLFCSECKWILLFPTLYVYCVYPSLSFSVISASGLRRGEASVVINVFIVFSVKSALILILLAFLTVAKQKKIYILVSDRI